MPIRLALAAALLLLASMACAELGPNSGPVIGAGQFDTGDGLQGRWQVAAELRDGTFHGTMRVEVGGQVLEAPLVPGGSFLGNGRCYLKFEQGRARFEISSPCGDGRFEGRVDAFLPGMGSLAGEASGTLVATGAEPAPATPGAAPLPAGLLTCAWMEREGGVVAGDLPDYHLRYSAMTPLRLSEEGRYKSGIGKGSFRRESDAIRLLDGPFAGALGALRPDRSDAPAVVFDLEANRAANGVPLIDPETTRCTRAGG